MSYLEVIDPTRLNDSLECLRLFYWKNERNIIPNKPRLPLSYGSGAHASLACHYRGESAGKALAAFEEVWERDVIALQSEMDEDDPKRNPVRWAETFMTYRQHYRSDAEHFKVLFVEAPFFLPLTDKIAVGGIIDLVIEYLNQIMVVDHKTTSVWWSSYFASFNPNHQFSAYLLGASELLKKPITTALINCILVHSSEMRPDKLFTRVPTTRSLSQHSMLKDEIVGWWSIVQECRRTGNWPRNPGRCQRWPNGCEYHSLCTEIQTDYRRIIPSKALFREEQWDPLRELREKGFKETI